MSTNSFQSTRQPALARSRSKFVLSNGRRIRRFRALLSVCLSVCGGLSTCSEAFSESTHGELSEADAAQIRQAVTDYRLGWLAGDRAKVLNLFADDATLVPSGLKPIQGKGEMSKFWWPDDGSKTTVNSYEIDLLKIEGSGRQAFSLENGRLSWSYAKGETRFSKKQESYEMTIFRKDSQGHWRIIERIWTDMTQ